MKLRSKSSLFLIELIIVNFSLFLIVSFSFFILFLFKNKNIKKTLRTQAFGIQEMLFWKCLA